MRTDLLLKTLGRLPRLSPERGLAACRACLVAVNNRFGGLSLPTAQTGALLRSIQSGVPDLYLIDRIRWAVAPDHRLRQLAKGEPARDREFLGAHRVLEPRGKLPQEADRLDARTDLHPTEVQIRVETLNIDAASFIQLEGTGQPVDRQVLDIVSQHGKMQNPVTGSGGMLLGRIEAFGERYRGPLRQAKVGDRIASLVSLTLTPLRIDRIRQVVPQNHQIDIDGRAFLFSSSQAAVIPDDLPERLTLAVLDVCGAPALAAEKAMTLPSGATVLMIGAGKAGLLGLAALRHSRPPRRSPLRIMAIDKSERALEDVRRLGLTDHTIALDCTDALKVQEAVHAFTGGRGVDLAINCASLPGTENATALATVQGGTAIFFGMATSFTKVALGMEGIGAHILPVIGNGYYPGHDTFALNLVRGAPGVKETLLKRMGLI